MSQLNNLTVLWILTGKFSASSKMIPKDLSFSTKTTEVKINPMQTPT
jgi:hypothetical protein